MIQPQADNSVNAYRDRVSKFSNELDIGLVLHILIKNIWIVLFLFVTSFSVAFLYLRYSIPIYQASSTIQIIDDNQATQVLQISKIEGGNNKIAEAIEQIKSKNFLRSVVEKSNIQVSYFNEGRFKNNELYKSSLYFVKFNIKDPLIYGTKIYINFNSLNNGKINFTLNGKNYIIPFNTNNVLNCDYFDLSFTLNKSLRLKQIQSLISSENISYFVFKNADQATSELKSALEVRLLNEAAKTILLSIKDVNAEKAKDLVNLIAEEYLKYDVDRKSESSKSIIYFIDEQLKQVYDALKVSENNLQNFRKEKHFSDKDDVLTSDLMRLNSIEEQMLKIELEEKLLAEFQSNLNKNKSLDTYQLLSLIAGTEDEYTIKQYTLKIQQLLEEKENLLYIATPNSENIKQINSVIETQKKFLIESINALRLKYKSKYSNLSLKSSEYKSKTDREPEEDMEHARLMRLFSISEKYYTLLLERKTEFSISKAGFVSQNVILDKALNIGEKISPNSRNSFLIATLSGLLFSIIIIFIKYILHNTITSVNEITKHLSSLVSVLGIVPNYKSDIPVSQLVVDKNPKSQISEAFRSIRSNLNFINNKPGPKIIAVTSSISGEGKTFVCLNIAGILAYTGKKVILLDLDMRKPKIHKGFGVSNDVGMSTILTNMTSIEECINKSNFPNLDYITAGPIPPNPSELIINERLDLLITELKKTYDFIVFDNPPIGLVTDGITTIQKADYPIYVFRTNYSKKAFVQILDKLISEGNIKNVGVILNGVTSSRSILGYNYGYGYGYGENYGNGYYDETSDAKKNILKSWKY
ncbi:MAG: polysaccharide biosynthesis tyrosine autokinase [Bacteroidota bacterium]